MHSPALHPDDFRNSQKHSHTYHHGCDYPEILGEGAFDLLLEQQAHYGNRNRADNNQPAEPGFTRQTCAGNCAIEIIVPAVFHVDYWDGLELA